ncbi:MAG: hypothetical protein QOI66_1892 [Myxococcales bacterium]|nr:hypothetical protein [Myxococcales bacterium]
MGSPHSCVAAMLDKASEARLSATRLQRRTEHSEPSGEGSLLSRGHVRVAIVAASRAAFSDRYNVPCVMALSSRLTTMTA